MAQPADLRSQASTPTVHEEPAAQPTAHEERLAWSTIVAYNIPTIGIGFMFFLIGLQLMKFSTDVLLVSPAAMGTIFGVSRLWDAVSDPIAGYLSDRTQTRLGRRRPWLLASALPIGAIYWLVWTPSPSLSQGALTAWMAFGVVGFYSAMTIFVVPHQSLGAELATGYHERSRIFGVRHALWSLGSVIALSGMYLLIVSEQPRETASTLAALGSLGTIGLIALSVGHVRERGDYLGRGATSPLAAVRDVLRNPHARLLLVVFFIENLGAATIAILTLYIAQYIVGTPELAPLYILAYMVPSIVSVPLWMPLARRFGKKPLWIFSMLLTSAAFGGMFFLEENSVVLITSLAAVAGLAAGCGGMVGPSVQADVIDFDEHESGERKEGAYFAAWNFVFKCAYGITLFLTGWVLQLSGFAPNQEQTESARLALLSLYSLFPLVCYAIGTLIFARFRLDEAMHTRIRERLDARALEARRTGP